MLLLDSLQYDIYGYIYLVSVFTTQAICSTLSGHTSHLRSVNIPCNAKSVFIN